MQNLQAKSWALSPLAGAPQLTALTGSILTGPPVAIGDKVRRPARGLVLFAFLAACAPQPHHRWPATCSHELLLSRLLNCLLSPLLNWLQSLLLNLPQLPFARPPQVAYTGLTALDQQSAKWAILYSNSTKSYWRYPAAYLGYCDDSEATPGGSGGGDLGAMMHSALPCTFIRKRGRTASREACGLAGKEWFSAAEGSNMFRLFFRQHKDGQLPPRIQCSTRSMHTQPLWRAQRGGDELRGRWGLLLRNDLHAPRWEQLHPGQASLFGLLWGSNWSSAGLKLCAAPALPPCRRLPLPATRSCHQQRQHCGGRGTGHQPQGPRRAGAAHVQHRAPWSGRRAVCAATRVYRLG